MKVRTYQIIIDSALNVKLISSENVSRKYDEEQTLGSIEKIM